MRMFPYTQSQVSFLTSRRQHVVIVTVLTKHNTLQERFYLKGQSSGSIEGISSLDSTFRVALAFYMQNSK